jgi:hypothetical protein
MVPAVRKILFISGDDVASRVTVVEYDDGTLGIHCRGTLWGKRRPASRLGEVLEDFTLLTSPVLPDGFAISLPPPVAAGRGDGAAASARSVK